MFSLFKQQLSISLSSKFKYINFNFNVYFVVVFWGVGAFGFFKIERESVSVKQC